MNHKFNIYFTSIPPALNGKYINTGELSFENKIHGTISVKVKASITSKGLDLTVKAYNKDYESSEPFAYEILNPEIHLRNRIKDPLDIIFADNNLCLFTFQNIKLHRANDSSVQVLSSLEKFHDVDFTRKGIFRLICQTIEGITLPGGCEVIYAPGNNMNSGNMNTFLSKWFEEISVSNEEKYQLLVAHNNNLN